MKKLLFVGKSFAMGGIQTSLLNLLDCIKDDYEIDLLLYYPEGPLKDRLPGSVRLIPPSWRLETLGMSFGQCMKRGSRRQKIFRLFATVWAKLFGNERPIAIAIRHQPFLGQYDAAVAYSHESRKSALTSGFIRVVHGCCKAKTKVSWVHSDTGTYKIDEAFNDPYYALADKIITVSASVRKGFIAEHPGLKEKTFYCYNFLKYKSILQNSLKSQTPAYPTGSFICFSACRLEQVKAIPRAIHAFAPVLKSHPELFWYIAGDGQARGEIEETIHGEGLENQVILLGIQKNPYPFMRNADLVLLVSYHEAAPMLYMEAKLLGLPIFTTRLSSTEEMIGAYKGAFICDNEEAAIREQFQWVADHREEVKRRRQEPDTSGAMLEEQKKQLASLLLE